MNSESSEGHVDKWQDQLPFYVAGTLADRERQKLEEHLQTCAGCRRSVESWQKIATVIRADAENRLAGTYVLPKLASSSLASNIPERESTMFVPSLSIAPPAFKSSQRTFRVPTIRLSAPGLAILLTALLGLTALFPLFNGSRGGFLSNASASGTPSKTTTPAPTSSCPSVSIVETGNQNAVAIANSSNGTTFGVTGIGPSSADGGTTISASGCIETANGTFTVQMCNQPALLLSTPLPPGTLPGPQILTPGCFSVVPVMPGVPGSTVQICSVIFSTAMPTMTPAADNMPIIPTVCAATSFIVVTGQACAVIAMPAFPPIATIAPGKTLAPPATLDPTLIPLPLNTACPPMLFTVPGAPALPGCVMTGSISVDSTGAVGSGFATGTPGCILISEVTPILTTAVPAATTSATRTAVR